MEDVVRQFGHLCLGSRLKRIGERLQADVVRYGDSLGLDVQPGQFPLLAALDLHGPLTVGQLVEAVGASQPGVTRNVARLSEAGLVETSRRHADQRHKTVSLTSAGQALIVRSKRELWPHIEAAAAELCEPLSGSLLDQLAALEDALAATPLDVLARRAAQ
jgi:DNA-binding MarR family transcriptional regulator